MRYEYSVIKPYEADLEVKLNWRGAQGWEPILFHTSSYEDMDGALVRYCTVVLRRPCYEPEPERYTNPEAKEAAQATDSVPSSGSSPDKGVQESD